MKKWAYKPRDFGFSGVKIPPFIQDDDDLCNALGKNYHNMWVMRRLKHGWKWNRERAQEMKENPALGPFEHLNEDDQSYNISAALDQLRMVMWMGFKIEPKKVGWKKPWPVVTAEEASGRVDFGLRDAFSTYDKSYGDFSVFGRPTLDEMQLIDIWQPAVSLPFELDEVIRVLGALSSIVLKVTMQWYIMITVLP